MIDWPASLINEVAKRRVILFLGAGVSASSKDQEGQTPPTWSEFMDSACNLVTDMDTQNKIRAIINTQNFLLALQAIKDNSDPGDYQELLNNSFNNPRFRHSPLHETLLKLDIPITLTTNFDKIYENYCESTSTEAYKVVTYSAGDLGDLIRSDARLILKAHGSINEIQSMVFTKADYHEAKRSHPNFYEMLKALCLTHTVIFIGCSMQDPDILLTLEDVKITASSSRPHYALIKEGANNDFETRELLTAYNIKALEYGPNHEDLVDCLNDLYDQVVVSRSTHFS